VRPTRYREIRNLRRASGLVCILSSAALSIQAVNPALGDDDHASQRDQAMRSIQSELQYIVKQLAGVADADSADPVNMAIRQASAIRQNTEAFDRFKGNDSDAEIVARYIGYLDKFDISAKSLLTLKNSQLELNASYGSGALTRTRTCARR
jgi:hypothetical protein